MDLQFIVVTTNNNS